MIKNIKFIAFDYYQTLVSIEYPFEAIKQWMKNKVIDISFVNIEKFYSRFTKYRAVLYTDGIFRLGIDLLSECYVKTCLYYKIDADENRFRDFIADLFSSPKAYDDANYVIERLRGKYKVGVLSNADNFIINQSIQKNGFKFDFVVTSEDAKANKPNKAFFLYAKNLLKANANEIALIGDSVFEDINGAASAGFSSILLNRPAIHHKNEGVFKSDYEVASLSKVLDIFM